MKSGGVADGEESARLAHRRYLEQNTHLPGAVLAGDVVLFHQRGTPLLGVAERRRGKRWVVSLGRVAVTVEESRLESLGVLDENASSREAFRRWPGGGRSRLRLVAALRAGELGKRAQSLLADEVERVFAACPYTLGPHEGIGYVAEYLKEATESSDRRLDDYKSLADATASAAELLARALFDTYFLEPNATVFSFAEECRRAATLAHERAKRRGYNERVCAEAAATAILSTAAKAVDSTAWVLFDFSEKGRKKP